MEQSGGGTSQSTTSSFIWLEGRTRPNLNCEIIGNNLGGGTNLDNSIYIDNAQRTIISQNRLVAVNVAEIYLTANSKYNIVRNDNVTISQQSNPRTRTAFKENVVDLGVGNYGVLQNGVTLSLANGWTFGGEYFKSGDGNIHFRGAFSGGSTASGTLIGGFANGI